MDFEAYEARAGSVRIEDIVSDNDELNLSVLGYLRTNSLDELHVQWYHDVHEDVDDCVEFCPGNPNELGWLAYFIGVNTRLQELHVMSFPGFGDIDVAGPFYGGVARNRSILDIGFHDIDLFGGRLFTVMGSFFEEANLSSITIDNCIFGDEGCRLLALAILSSASKSLRRFSLTWNNAGNDGMTGLIVALSTHPFLESFELDGCILRKNGFVELAGLLGATTLKRLHLASTDINDEGLDTLLPALANSSTLEDLSIANDSLITTGGWRSIASLLHEETSMCRLAYLLVNNTNVDDEVIVALASALKKNTTLSKLDLDGNESITNRGWAAVSKLLCDTSSVNATYLSNHTLSSMGVSEAMMQFAPLLRINNTMLRGKRKTRRANESEIAKLKILKHHQHFNVRPFFEWEFKFLPMLVGWLEKASVCVKKISGYDANIEGRKLYSIYQFVRAMPVEYVEASLRKELSDIKAKQRQLQEREHCIRKKLKLSHE